MMGIRKIFLITATVFITCLKGQITDDSIKTINDLYAQYYTSDLLIMSTSHKWAVISDKNSYGLERAHLVQLQTSRSTPIALSYRSYFFADDLLIIQEVDRTVIRCLKDMKEIELKGNYSYEAFEKEGKLLFYDRQKKELLLFDRSGKRLRSYQGIESFGRSSRLATIVFRSPIETFCLDLKTLRVLEWRSAGKVLWQSLRDDEVVSLESDGQQYQVSRYGKEGKIMSEKLNIPQGFYLDSLSTIKMALKNDRYLILPLLKKTERARSYPSEILYTNKNSIHKNAIGQMAVYDLMEHQWKRIPDDSDLFAIQMLLDDLGTVMSYDPASDIIENENNPHYQMTIERNFGEGKVKIDQSHERRSNYHYDSITKRMIYFRDNKWWIEDTNNGVVSEIPFEKPSNFISWVFNGLSDYSSGNAYPTNRKGSWIISDGYDLFLVDVVKISVKRLTYGRENNVTYSIPENFRLNNLKGSYWDTAKRQQINMDKRLILKAFYTTDFTSGLAELDMAKFKLRSLVKLNDVIQEIFVTDDAITFTAQCYDQPLSIYALSKDSHLRLLYHSKGKEGSEPPVLKKEIVQYKVGNQWHNAALLYPLNYKKGGSFPIIFNIYEKKSKDITTHMLPTLNHAEGVSPIHYVYQDYFVLLPDLAYETEHVGRSISESVEELVAVLGHNKAVDLKRMAVSGISFGGYESFYLMAKGKWFKTGFAGVGIADLPSNAMSFTKNLRIPNYFKDEKQQSRMDRNLFDNYQGYVENSPIYHLKTMTQPMLIWLGQNDRNVDPDQSRMFFLGMKRLGKKGILLEYPNEGHLMKQKDNLLDLNIKGWEWMEYHLKGRLAADWIKPVLE